MRAGRAQRALRRWPRARRSPRARDVRLRRLRPHRRGPHVGAVRCDLPPRLPDFLLHLVGAVSVVGDRHVSSRHRQAGGDGPPDPYRTTGYEGHLAEQAGATSQRSLEETFGVGEVLAAKPVHGVFIRVLGRQAYRAADSRDAGARLPLAARTPYPAGHS